jgi:hypothetical protein
VGRVLIFDKAFPCGWRNGYFSIGEGHLLAGWLFWVWLAGSRPAATHFAFASPKESKQRKGDPQSGSLRFASGNLRWSKKAGVELELACGSDNRSP